MGPRSNRWITCFLHETGKRPDYPFYPHPGGLFPIGQEDNGNYVIHWLMEGEPDDWPIVVLLYRGHVPDWTFDGNLTAFLAALFRMEIDCPIAPHDPSRPIEFEPVENWGREVPL